MEERLAALVDGLGALVAWIEEETGLLFPEVHHDTIRKVAEARCGELGLEYSFYRELLRGDLAEKGRFFNEIMIGETYFFRDEKHFAALISGVLPGLMKEGRELRLWSATCATGEEAVSLVASVEQVRARLGSSVGYSVLATDINMNALAALESGRFPLSSFRNDGRSLHGLLDLCGAMEGGEWRASAECLSRIRARQLNILSGELCEPESLDIVFFRNTLVYMQQEQKERVVSRIVKTLRPGGYLFLASPEIPSVRHPLLEVQESCGCFFFRRLSAPEPPRAKDQRAAAPPPRARPREAREREPAAKAPHIGSAELERGLELAAAWMRDPSLKIGQAEGRGTEAVASMIEAIIEAIHSNRFVRADELLGDFEARAGESYLSQYLRALSRKHQGDMAGALDLWERAGIYEPGFWPALFQAGMACAKTDPERCRTLLGECLGAMEGGRDDEKYLVLLEGFDTAYYRRMVERMLARAGGR